MAQRFGKPQYLALLLLFAFLAQCVWLAWHTPATNAESRFFQIGKTEEQQEELKSGRNGFVFVAVSIVARLLPNADAAGMAYRLPFILAGALLGASVWYVSRRLYGNRAGFIALAMYCFSPLMIIHSARIDPIALAAFGAYGLVFTGIATAHTLYAPREVVLWNWRRILLLSGVIAAGVAGEPAVLLLVGLTAAFMFYLVPHRKGASLAILAAASAIAALLLITFAASDITYHFAPTRWAVSSRVIASAAAWKMVGILMLRNGPSFVFLLLVAIGVYVRWRHTRYFGTHAPLAVAVFVVVAALAMPTGAGITFAVVALPFLCTFMSGICADMLESRDARWRGLAIGIVLAAMVTQAMFSLNGLRQLKGGTRLSPMAVHAGEK